MRPPALLAVAAVFLSPAFTPALSAVAVREFRYADGANILPSYRTWEFEVDAPGLYVFDIGSEDGKAAPAVRAWLDGVQIGYVLDRSDWQAKTERTAGHLRRFRWLETGRHSLDLYLNVGAYQWHDDMARAMGEKGIRATIERLSTSDNCQNGPLIANANSEVGFWMEGTDPDCMARVMGEPLVVAACAAGDFNAEAQRRRAFTMEVRPAGDCSQISNVHKSSLITNGTNANSDLPFANRGQLSQLPIVDNGGAANVSTAVWSQTLAVGETPVRFEYPCPEEGAFEFVVKDAAGEVVEGPWAFVVTDLRTADDCSQISNIHKSQLSTNGTNANANSDLPLANCSQLSQLSIVDNGGAILIDRVDCAEEGSGGPHLFREGGKSEIIDTPDGAYRRSGPQGYKDVFRRQNPDGSWSPAKPGEKGAQRKRFHDWFAYTLKVEHPGRSHALVVRVPNDMRHLTHVVAYDRRTRLSNAWGIDSGDAPAAGPWSEMKIPVWPNTDAIDVMVISTDNAVNTHIPHPNRRGAVASLSLLEYPDGFPALEAPACGWNESRNFGWKGEQIDLGPHERTMPRLSDKALEAAWARTGKPNVKGPAYSWEDFLETWERTFELEAWRGGTTLMYPVYSYSMVTFQGPAQKLIPAGYDRYTHQRAGMEPVDPFDRDEFALMLQRAQKHGVRLVADFMIQRIGSHVVSAWCERYGMGGATNGFYLVASADGKPYRPAHCVYFGMPNPAHPAARAVQIEFCREFGRRYGRYESFAGIRNRFWRGWPSSFSPWFYSEATGFDDFTVGEFSKATGIGLPPVGNDEAAFDARKKRIIGEYGREWNAWRTKVCLSLQEEMLAALREGAPRARLYNDRSPDDYDAACGLDPAVFAERRDLGFSRDQTSVRGPGVEINHLDPIHFAKFWVHRPEDAAEPLPPPTGLCCNSSYRCAPYNLEPAALALAENRLDHIWAGGSWCLPPLDDALREFVRAYRAIPDRSDWRKAPIECSQISNVHKSSLNTNANLDLSFDNCEQLSQLPIVNNSFSPVAVWWAKDGDDVLFWAVNRTDASRRVMLTFDREPSALEDCVSGRSTGECSQFTNVHKSQLFTNDTNDANDTNTNANSDLPFVNCDQLSQLPIVNNSIFLTPFMPGVFRAKGVTAISGVHVPVEPEEAAQIERDYAFIAALGETQRGGGLQSAVTDAARSGDRAPVETAVEIAQNAGETQRGGGLQSAVTDAARSGDRAPVETAVEIAQNAGETYFAPAGQLGKRDRLWTFADLFSPMREAHDAGDFHSLRTLLADFKTNHRWWFEAFGWPDDFCVRRNVGRLPLVGFLRQGKRTEMWFGETNGLFTANFSEKFPQCKKDFVCAPQGVALDILRHGQPGGFRQLELSALFGGGYGAIRVEDADGKLIGVVNASSFADCPQISNIQKSSLDGNSNSDLQIDTCGQLSQLPIAVNPKPPRPETRVLSVPVPNPGHRTHVRLVGTGEKGLAVYRLDFVQQPPRPIARWQVIGPFDKGGGEKDRESYEKAFPPETEPFDANAEYIGMGGETVRWKTVTLGPGERVVNVAVATPCDVSRCNAVTYLRTTIRAPRRMPTMLRYCNDYYGKIWLNGKPIVPAMRGPAQKYEFVEVTLQKGENVILVKTSPGSAGTWHFGAAVNDCGELEFVEDK